MCTSATAIRKRRNAKHDERYNHQGRKDAVKRAEKMRRSIENLKKIGKA